MFEKYLKCRIWILTFSTNVCPIKSDLSGNAQGALVATFASFVITQTSQKLCWGTRSVHTQRHKLQHFLGHFSNKIQIKTKEGEKSQIF